jgi:hypothetical protein
MIASKQIAFGKAAGAKKPYDAEIEYLESTKDGGQYIDLREIVKVRHTDKIDVGLLIDKVEASSWSIYYPISAFNTVVKNGYALLLRALPGGGEGATYFNCFNAANVLKGRYNEFNTFHIENGLQTLGDSKTTNTFTSELDDAGVLLFARLAGTGAVTIAGTWGPISFFKVERDGEKIIDLIPVRVGSVGYMYDKVSGKLFGNEGTGAFIIGDDV